jgi:4a-hydroxytetrahydrobiopterin dehydratase
MNNFCEIKLSDKKCIPCEGGIPPMNKENAEKMLLKLKNGWTINQKGHLEKKIDFPDFVKAMNFANQVAEIAESEAHHPDLHIFWGGVIVEIWTHKINGLNESDFILAAKIDHL